MFKKIIIAQIAGVKRAAAAEELVVEPKRIAVVDDEEVAIVGMDIRREIEMPCLKTFFMSLIDGKSTSFLNSAKHIPLSSCHGYMRICMFQTPCEYPGAAEIVVRFSYDTFLYDRNPQNTYHRNFIAQFATIGKNLRDVLKKALDVKRVRILIVDHSVFTITPAGAFVSRLIPSDHTQARLFPGLLTIYREPCGTSQGGLYHMSSDFTMVKVTANGLYHDGSFERVREKLLGGLRMSLTYIANLIQSRMSAKAMATPIKCIKIRGVEVDSSLRLTDFVFINGVELEITISH